MGIRRQYGNKQAGAYKSFGGNSAMKQFGNFIIQSSE